MPTPTFFRAESVYSSIDIHGHGVTIGLGSESIRMVVLGVLGRSRGVVSSHHLSLMPVIIEGDCLRHPSSKGGLYSPPRIPIGLL